MKPISTFRESGSAPAQTNFSIGDHVSTPAGSQGVIIPPNHEMPLHHLVLFDDDQTFWTLKEILQPAPIKAATETKKRRQTK